VAHALRNAQVPVLLASPLSGVGGPGAPAGRPVRRSSHQILPFLRRGAHPVRRLSVLPGLWVLGLLGPAHSVGAGHTGPRKEPTMTFEDFYQTHCAFWQAIDVGRAARRWERALDLIRAKAVEERDGRYGVASQNQQGVRYAVTFGQQGAPSCTCPDATKATATSAPWGWCKHALAALMLSCNGKARPRPEYQEPEEPEDPADLSDPLPPTQPYRAVRCPVAGHKQPKTGRYGLFCPTKLNDGSWCKWTASTRKEQAA